MSLVTTGTEAHTQDTPFEMQERMQNSSEIYYRRMDTVEIKNSLMEQIKDNEYWETLRQFIWANAQRQHTKKKWQHTLQHQN